MFFVYWEMWEAFFYLEKNGENITPKQNKKTKKDFSDSSASKQDEL